MDVRIGRIYHPPTAADGHRVLVDRLWPRGLSKERAALDEWLRAIAPSDELRRWFKHDPERWDEFQQRYRAELDSGDAAAALAHLRQLATAKPVLTLLYAAHDETHNNAAVLQGLLMQDDN